MATKPFTDESVQIPQESLRLQLERTVQSLIDILDVLEPEADAEEDDEPEAEEDCCEAGDDGSGYGQQQWGPGSKEDAEDDNEDACSVLDYRGELSLSCSEAIDQSWWSHGGLNDREADYCDKEDDDPAEDGWDLELDQSDREPDRWYRTERDLALFKRRYGRDLPGPGRVTVQKGRAYWYPDTHRAGRRDLMALLEQANKQ